MVSKIVGYCFAKTSDHNAQKRVEAQHQKLLAAGISQIYSEIDDRHGERVQLKALIKMVENQEVSEVAVTSLDRFTRSLGNWIEMTSIFEQSGVKLRVVDSSGDDYLLDRRDLPKGIRNLLGDPSQCFEGLHYKFNS